MKSADVRRLIDDGLLRHPCDLDLLLFFVRHPRSLLTSESLAAFLGYEIRQIAESLEVLLSAGLVKRTQTPAHAARLYVLAADTHGDGWLPSLLALASTRPGRLALREALAPRRPREKERTEGTPAEEAGPRPVFLPMKAKASRRAETG